ncbi:putative transferase [Helianthus annuus]|nr:putative transferase [Helianthus annuus]
MHSKWPLRTLVMIGLWVGAFGKVYKGWVEQETYVPSKVGSGIPIAVKKLDTDGYQGFEEWQVISSYNYYYYYFIYHLSLGLFVSHC